MSEFIKHSISEYAADNLDCESDHTLFTSFFTVDWKQPVIIWVSLIEFVHVLQYIENVSLRILYQLATTQKGARWKNYFKMGMI